MPELVLQVDVEAPPEQVWAALVDWDRQGEWMLLTDVRAGAQGGQGVGGELAAVTGVKLPVLGRRLGVLDTMLITSWDAPRRVDVRHTGRVVRGTGTFEVRPRTGGGSTFVWTEGLDLPLGALGRAGWPLVRPVFAAGVRLSLKRFATYAATYPR
ncbi:SRPBCC family protein [Modestobacter sp. VKM Ac-2986]|uniref:SRPBCC family protein n=1 Tax=Modestobacter sp. VKM Ac-2986 TaxID=3004140 RepID=UPI0022AB8D7A|nr:SRPBCC family protein [Modestobacter sp. VKM Ac-2986]MCZ2830391.1 SRPBCC family protein [Modestobacter sp. VKM Ac-2986]